MDQRNKKFRSETGFTIVELLAAMVVSSLVVAFVLSMYLFSERVMVHRQKDIDVKDAVSRCAQKIAMDIESSNKLVQCDDTSLVFVEDPVHQNQPRQIEYRFIEMSLHGKSSGIWRNGVLVNDPQTELAVHVSFDDDTTSAQPLRLWNIRVVGWQGEIRDSSILHISTIISSQELVDRSTP